MGVIIAFAPRAREKALPQSAPPSADGAEILFFTGVRYERMDEAEAPARKAARKNKKKIVAQADAAATRKGASDKAPARKVVARKLAARKPQDRRRA